MNEHVSWVFELAIKEGQLENLKKLMVEMVDATKANEAGTLIYEWTISEDSKQCHTYERYADSKATLTHLETFVEKYAGRLMETGDATRFVVYGNPNDEVKKSLEGFGAAYMLPIGGFAR